MNVRKIRKLYFQNASGDRWGLNGEKNVYASSLSGFGVALEPSAANIGHGFFPLTDDVTEPQNSLAFTLTFTQSPYETYHQLMNWLATAGTIMIVYTPYGNQEYFRDVAVNFIEKSELTQTAWLEAPCSFRCLAPWRQPSPASIEKFGSFRPRRKRYGYQYFDLRYGSDRPGSLVATIAPSGQIPAALDVRYSGAAQQPRISLVGNNSGKTYGVCAVNTSLEAGDTLLYSSRYDGAYVRKVSAAGVESDLIDAVDLSGGPFFRIPVHEPCTLYIEASGAVTGAAKVTVHYYYRSV